LFFKKSTKLEELEFPKQIEISNKSYCIQVIFSTKRSSSVSIKDNTLIFRLSSLLTKKLAHQHFSDLLKRIYLKIEKSPNKEQQYTIDNIIEKKEFKFANEIYYLEFTNKIRGVKLEQNIFYVNYSSKKENIEKNILKLLTQRYSNRLIHYIQDLNSRTYNYTINEISLKLVNSKWGHCTFDNKIMLNLKLLNAPIEILDYVILHEIAHIKHKNHSQTYWREVQRFCPNYKLLRKQLKTNPPVLFNKV